MIEYITKEQALSAMRKATNCTWDDIWNTEYVLNSVPAADVAPVVHAHWITAEDDDFWTCSNCRKFIHKNCAQGYCPKCGARMDGDQQCK